MVVASVLRRTLLAGTASALLGGFLVVPASTATAATNDPSAVAPCVAGQQQRNYDIAAVTVNVPFNRWGRTLRNARIFVLEQDLAATVNWSRPLRANPDDDPADNRRLRPRPLVLRANEGECLRITLTNKMSSAALANLPGDPRVGIQAAGVVMDMRNDGGARVGFNQDPTVGIGESTTYMWKVPSQEGLFMFQDMATPAGGESDGGSRGAGLYGALAVEPAGSVWTDPRSGSVLSGTAGDPGSTYTAAGQQSGEMYVEAEIHPPNAPSFRESVQLAQDEIPGIGMGFNYGSEPMSDRESKLCPDCLGEETWLSSWPYGDPALIKLASGPGPWLPGGTGADRKEKEDCGLPESCYVSNVFHSYTGDATKIRFGLAGVKETHVFHVHAHQWLADPRENAVQGTGPGAKPQSSTIDSQSYGPGEAYTAELLYGAGSRNGTFGDSIFHCHLYPHFAEGYWAILRVHDVLVDGSTATPDGVNVRPLIPLRGRPSPPAPSAENPGYPGMVPGTYGWRAPQPPNSVTEGGVDGTPERPAPRLVGGKAIDAAKLAVEKAVMAARNGGLAAPPGAPYADPCPAGAREVDYDVTVLQRDLVYNEAGHHDPQARFMALTKDVPAILAGTKRVEPLFIRVNAGDCINFSLTNKTNNWTGADAFQQLTQTNMAGGHIHLVKYDVTASDGGSNGWNYQQAAFTKEQAALSARQASGATSCTAGTPFFGGPSTGCRIAQPDSWSAPKDSAGLWGQTLHERWYADYELRTAFTHDHHFPAVVQNHGQYGALIVEPSGFDVRDPATGGYLQPVNDPAHDTPCGTRCTGAATGESADLVGPGANDDYRELGLAIADFVPLVKKGGDPTVAADVVNPPHAPEYYPSHDPGTYAINYRNAPLSERRTRDGTVVDPAYRFSSWVFGDPQTPLLQGYARDNVKMRVIQGSQEEQHVFQAHGLRWREEPDDPDSPLVSAQTIGISEAFNAEMAGFDCKNTDTPCRGDYLYGGTSMEDQWNGMWGIMRIHGTPTPGLQALPDNPPTGTTVAAPVPASRQVPPRAPRAGVTCPTTAPIRTYDVVAMTRNVVYNQHGDNDPKGLMYVLAEDETAVRAGTKKPEPLVLRANAGDCVRVSLRNALPTSYARNVNGVGGDTPLVMEPSSGTPMGTRVSLHPQLVRHDVRLSDGAAVGFNPDSTARIGETVNYEWYADSELGATNLVDYGDVRGHRQHGLAAALVVEPKQASYHDPVTGAPLRSGVAADIRVPGPDNDFRETALVYQDGLDLRTSAGAAIEQQPLPAELEEGPEIEEADGLGGETEDAGEKAVNYTNAPLHRRLGAGPGALAFRATSAQWANVLSSATHGDPLTPLLRGYAGDRARVRVLGGAKQRQTGFQLDGTSWAQEPSDSQSELVGVQGGIGAGKAVNAHVRWASVGDHLWTSPTSGALPQGLWGLSRVYAAPTDTGAGFQPTPLRSSDNPYIEGSYPLQPLERSGAVVTVFDDTDGDGTRDAGELGRAGTTVRLLDTSGATVSTRATSTDGTVAFSPSAGVYDVEVVAPTGSAVVGLAKRRVDLSAASSRVDLAVGLSRSTSLTALVYDDRDGDGTQDAGEPGLPGFTLTLDGGSHVPDATTGTNGTAVFGDLTAGSWSAGLLPRTGWRATTTLPAVVTVGDTPATVALGVARRPGFLVRAVDDADADGVADADERVLDGVTVETTVTGSPATRTASRAEGAWVDTSGAAASLRVVRPDDVPWRCASARVTTASGSSTVACSADGTVAVPAGAIEVVVLGAFPDAVVTATLFDDADSDSRVDAGEPPLVDWPVTLVGADGTEVARATTSGGGRARFVVPPGSYRVVPLPPVAAVPWTSTLAATAVEAVRAANAATQSGWMQRGSVAVGVFHDRDRDGTQDDDDEPLANRTVRLLTSAGAVVAAEITDGTGRAAFAARAGTSYTVEATVPTGWQATAPLAGGAVQTKVPVTAPADGGQGTVSIGHYNTVDRTAPAAPATSPGGALVALTGATSVTVTGETGATLRYTLDGTTPTATRGMVYAAPVRISTDRVLKAVAVDAAGNVSPVAATSFDLPWTGTSRSVTAGVWTATTGTVRGTATDGAADDGSFVSVASGLAGTRPTADVTAGVVLPTTHRAPVALNVSASLRTTLRGTRVRLQWYDVTTSTWRNLSAAFDQGLDEARVDLDLPGATSAVDASGTVKVRFIADNGSPFDLAVDQLVVTAVNRR